MTLAEILKSQGLTDEQITTIEGEMKQNKIFTSAEENIDIRFGKLQTDFNAKTKEHADALATIQQLQSAAAGNADTVQQINDANAKIAQLEAENAEIKAENAAKMALLNGKAKAEDIDYLIYTYKQQNGGKLELDENGELKGFDVEALKTAKPNNFEAEGVRKVDVHKLNEGEGENKGVTKAQFDKMSYKERTELYESDRETYDKLSKN